MSGYLASLKVLAQIALIIWLPYFAFVAAHKASSEACFDYPDNDEVIDRVLSPNHALKAIGFVRHGKPPTTIVTTHVRITSPYEITWHEPGNVLLLTGRRNITLEWDGNDHLIVHGHLGQEHHLKLDEFNGITISYKQ